MAVELLTPMHYKARMDHYLDEGVDSMTVATEFRIPNYIAEWAINGGWMERVRLHESIG